MVGLLGILLVDVAQLDDILYQKLDLIVLFTEVSLESVDIILLMP